MARFNFSFSQERKDFNFTFGEGRSDFCPEFGTVFEVESGAGEYEGTYEVTPSVIEQIILPTKEKKMKDDVTVHELPTFRTSNPEGGVTVYIGRKVGL